MVEVPWIYADSQRMSHIDHLLQNYRSLVTRLEDIDLRKMKHEEKLAFWINIHNALVMHVTIFSFRKYYFVPSCPTIQPLFFLFSGGWFCLYSCCKHSWSMGFHKLVWKEYRYSSRLHIILGVKLLAQTWFRMLFWDVRCLVLHSGFGHCFLQGQSLKPEMIGKHMQLTQNLFYTLHCVQEAIRSRSTAATTEVREGSSSSSYWSQPWSFT